jgi:integrase
MAEISAAGLKAKLAALAKAPPAKPVRIGAGEGLHLLVKPGQPAGTGAWVLRMTVNGQRRDMGLGTFPARGLAEARIAASEARRQVRLGTDPIATRAAARQATRPGPARVTFKDAAEALHASKAAEWRNPKHGQQWLASLTLHVFPVLGALPVAEVGTDDVLRALQPVWTSIPETASRLRGRIENVLDYAAAKGIRPRGPNPAIWRGHLAEVLGKPSRLKAAARRERGRGDNHASLPWQEVPAFVDALARGDGVGSLGLRFLILTGARSGEVRGMTWGEVDEAKRLWVVPAARMKGGKTHFVPLSAEAMAVLDKMKPLADGRDSFVFPGARAGRPLSDMTLGAIIKRMNEDAADTERPEALPRWRDAEGRPIVVHGMRATFKAWSLAHGWPDHLSEKALAHADKDRVRAAYAREPLTEERRPMMDAWATWCATSKPATVASLAAAKAKRRGAA